VNSTFQVPEKEDAMLIDCDRCAMRNIACADCVMTMLLGSDRPAELDDDECRAVDLLAEAGLVAPLRLAS